MTDKYEHDPSYVYSTVLVPMTLPPGTTHVSVVGCANGQIIFNCMNQDAGDFNPRDARPVDEWVKSLGVKQEPTFTYVQTKKAIELFEKEYVGQNTSVLWKWAMEEASK